MFVYYYLLFIWIAPVKSFWCGMMGFAEALAWSNSRLGVCYGKRSITLWILIAVYALPAWNVEENTGIYGNYIVSFYWG